MDKLQKVIATGFDVSFLRKAGFTIKREVTAIPAALILVIAGFLSMGILGWIILPG
jgi:hypothetical protein